VSFANNDITFMQGLFGLVLGFSGLVYCYSDGYYCQNGDGGDFAVSHFVLSRNCVVIQCHLILQRPLQMGPT
jgi:hypothetical protein